MQQTTSTGATNLEYDLVAEMHELLEGNAALEQYIQDAKQAGDKEVERCFTEIHDQNRQHVSSLRELLARCLSGQGQQQGQNLSQGQSQQGQSHRQGQKLA